VALPWLLHSAINSVRDFSIFRKNFFLRNTFWRLPQNFLSNFKKNFPFEFRCIQFNFNNSTIFYISYNVMFLTTLLQQRKYRPNFSVFSAKAKTFPQCGKIFGALFMTLAIVHIWFLKWKMGSSILLGRFWTKIIVYQFNLDNFLRWSRVKRWYFYVFKISLIALIKLIYLDR
jgi:hypothetical protein